MKILLTGRGGQVGSELLGKLKSAGEVIATGRAELDLADVDAIRRVVRETRPGLIVNAAAYTAVDKAESEPALAAKINAMAPGVLAEEAKRLGALLVHYSTDYVFDGEKNAPYVEDDAPRPLNAYGRTKLEGETRVRASGCRHLLLRASWVYGLQGRNFLLAILDRARRGERLRVVGDQVGAPTSSATIARVTVQCLKREGEGLFHLSASGATSWCGFARAALQIAGLENDVEEIATSEYPTAAQRPRYSVLANARLQRTFGLRLADWREDLVSVLS